MQQPFSPFARLVDVYIQLVMQQLDTASLLRLARCSRLLLHAASHPLAWQHATCTIRHTRVDRALVVPSARTGLAGRLQPIYLIWDSEQRVSDGDTLQLLAGLRSLTSVCFTFPLRSWSAHVWESVLASPLQHRLRSVGFSQLGGLNDAAHPFLCCSWCSCRTWAHSGCL